MRLLLDANLSGRSIGRPLRAAGHDVYALNEEPVLAGLPDVEVLELAVREERILVTRNAKHFVPILRGRAEAERSHAGCVLIWGLDDSEFGRILCGLEQLLAGRPTQAQWVDVVLHLSPARLERS